MATTSPTVPRLPHHAISNGKIHHHRPPCGATGVSPRLPPCHHGVVLPHRMGANRHAGRAPCGARVIALSPANGDHTILLGRVAELLNIACQGTEPLCPPPMPRPLPQAGVCLCCICSPLRGGPGGPNDEKGVGRVLPSTQEALPQAVDGMDVPSWKASRWATSWPS